MGGKITAPFSPLHKGRGNCFPLFQQSLPYLQRSRLRSPTSQNCKCPKPLLSLEFFFCLVIRMGRFTSLVSTSKGREAFKAKYNIPIGVEIKHCHLREWYTKRPIGAVVIPMIAFIEGGMQIPMGRVMRDFLIFYRLCPTQCNPNLFRVLGSVDMLNRKIGVSLSHHEVNWVYNCQNSKDIEYYLRTRVLGFMP